MTAGLLPLEKIPIFVWGVVLAVVGGTLVIYADAFSWSMVKAISRVCFGLGATVYDVSNRMKRSEAERHNDETQNGQE